MTALAQPARRAAGHPAAGRPGPTAELGAGTDPAEVAARRTRTSSAAWAALAEERARARADDRGLRLRPHRLPPRSGRAAPQRLEGLRPGAVVARAEPGLPALRHRAGDGGRARSARRRGASAAPSCCATATRLRALPDPRGGGAGAAVGRRARLRPRASVDARHADAGRRRTASTPAGRATGTAHAICGRRAPRRRRPPAPPRPAGPPGSPTGRRRRRLAADREPARPPASGSPRRPRPARTPASPTTIPASCMWACRPSRRV